MRNYDIRINYLSLQEYKKIYVCYTLFKELILMEKVMIEFNIIFIQVISIQLL